VRPGQASGAEEKIVLKTKPTWAKERKKKVNLSLPPWLTQGQGGTKKVHHPSTLVHWWVLVHSGPIFVLAHCPRDARQTFVLCPSFSMA
jgi:hypothetical protein